MITLALALVLPLTASAQTFEDSLSVKIVLPAKEAKAAPQKPAAGPKAPSAPEATWAKIVAAVKKDGKYKPEAGMMPGRFSLEDSTGDVKGDHTVQSISFLGMLDEDEKFEALGAMLVIKVYTLDPKDGNFHIDMWMFQTDVYGEVANAGHGVLVTSPDGKTVSQTPDQLNPADPKIQAQYDLMLKHWAERK